MPLKRYCETGMTKLAEQHCVPCRGGVPPLQGADLIPFAQQLPEPWQQPAAITVNVLHGICYAFFFATVYIFIDEYFPKDARTSAQGLFNMLILGLGPIASNFVSGRLGERFAPAGSPADFKMIFMVPLCTALVAAALLVLFFHPPKKAV